jgi:transposase
MTSYYLGIDVSKGYADFAILDSSKQPVEEGFQLDDTFEGHSFLYQYLIRFCQNHPEALIHAALESTGGYENNWLNTLVKFQSSLNLKAARLNPFGVNANSKADLKRITTDEISAQSIAEYLIAHPEKVSYAQPDNLVSLRRHWSFTKLLTKQHTQLLIHLQSQLYSANPEILTYCKHHVRKWTLEVLKRYPTASHLSRARVSTLTQIPYVNEAKARELVNTAKHSVASATDDITGNMIISIVKQIQHLRKLINSESDRLAKEFPCPEVELLKTFIGINDYSAIGLMLEIGAIERFPRSKNLTAYFGLHPVYRASGDGIMGMHMSKKGRREPRRILFMVALAAIRDNPLIREIYLKHTERGMEKMAAIGLCMHKILRIIYGMLKHQRPFDPEIDQRNRERVCDNRTDRPDKSRRYQTYDSKAPISSRQSKKRKERNESQNGRHTPQIKNGIIVTVPPFNLSHQSISVQEVS